MGHIKKRKPFRKNMINENEPCLCRSGKKFKNCCIGIVIPFPTFSKKKLSHSPPTPNLTPNLIPILTTTPTQLASQEYVPFMKHALYFLNFLHEKKEVKATAKGNLPRFFVHDLHEKFFKWPDFDFTPQSEEYSLDISLLRTTLELAGLIKCQKLKFSLTEKGRKMREFGSDKEFSDLYELMLLYLNGEIET